MRLVFAFCLRCAILTAGVVASTTVLGAAKSELWERWATFDTSAVDGVSHAEWDSFLQHNVVTHADGINRIDYGAVNADDRRRLDNYIKHLSAIPITAHNRDEQLAYWINLYNALTVSVVLAHYPVASIRDISISPGLFARGPWGKALVKVEGVALTLDDIEHRILRPLWRDPRIHYAVNCASLGCPNLMARAFTAQNTQTLLDQGAHGFINHVRGVLASRDRLVTSSIYHWFKEDFGGNDRGVIAHLRDFATPQLDAVLKRHERIDDHRYDWSLNDR